MSERVGREYTLTIQNPLLQTVIIQPPFTLHIDVNRDTAASVNKATLDLYELGPNTRNFLYKDKYTTNEYWQMKLDIGYGYQLFNVFLGNIYECFSYKQGVHWITHIEGFDGLFGVQNSNVNLSVPAGSNKQNILQMALQSIPTLTQGALGSPAQGTYQRGRAYMGRGVDFINDETQGQYFIDKEQLHILGDNEVLDHPVVLLESSYIRTTPKRRETMLEVDMNMTPELQVGGLVQLESLFQIYNGQYECMGVHHSGVISPTEAGDFTTSVQLYAGSRAFKTLKAGPN